MLFGHVVQWQMIPPVDTVSGDEGQSSEGDALLAVERVSSSESDESVLPVRKKRKRSTTGMNVRERLSNEAELRTLVGRSCKKCSQHCLAKFQDPEQFAKLLSFRETWTGLHKQDQDQVATWQN